MNSVYESIMTGFAEAVEDANSTNKKLKRRIVTIEFPFVKISNNI